MVNFLVVIGLSGSGKSTLLRCINRLINPTEGEIIWTGVDLAKLEGEELRKARRKIGMVFQHFNLVERSSVMTNILTGRLGYSKTANDAASFSSSFWLLLPPPLLTLLSLKTHGH